MTPLPPTDAIRALAERLIWFEPAEKALADPVRLAAYAFAHATYEQMQVLRRYWTDADLIEALDHAPPGIIDPRSWAYWNAHLGRFDPPPLPTRRFA